MVLEPIRQVFRDDKREEVVINALKENINNEWQFYKTPPFYFMDFHLTRRRANGRENYLGDLEIKWLNAPASTPTKFPFQKLAKILIAPPYSDHKTIFHRICFRYNDGLLLIPAQELGGLVPEFTVRHDTGERDLNIVFMVEDYAKYWLELIVNE